MKKIVTVGMVLVMILSLAVGCAKKVETPTTDQPAAATTEAAVAATEPAAEKVTIGVSISNYDDKWLSYLLDSMKAYAATVPNSEFLFVDGKGDIANQLGQVENFIAQGVDAMIINPVDTDGSGPMTDKANAAGIPIVSVNRPFKNQADAASYCGGDSKQSGVLEMEYLAEKMGGKGNLVIMVGEPTHEAAVLRTEGFKEVLANYPDIKIVAEQTANWDRAKGMALMENWLQMDLGITAVAANNDEMALGAIKALQAAGKLDQVIVGGIDASPDALASLKAGEEAVTVFQDAAGQGQGAIDAAIMAINKDSNLKATYMIPYQLVVKEDADKYLEIWGIK